MIKRGFFSVALMAIGFSVLFAQQGNVTVDSQGVMRWPNGTEVQGFGVNYTVPFAHAHRSAERLGVDHKQAIDEDVYHFARLGFDAYRVHVWDTEISDTLGNLLENEHLELFDYLLKKMQERGMKILVTPIAFWGNGWPERDENTPGFARKYGKDNCLTNEEAIKAQENYLYQFLNHVNPYTGLAYKDDPNIVAFEVSNEPHHRQSADSVTRYVSKMVKAMRRTGCGKPIFYNISHGIHLVDAYYEGGVQGGTFQWYPTGLGAGEEIRGNLLPNVDRYAIPFADNPRFQQGAKVVYEFDAADVGRSYIYPAMARSFRTAGIQWATHFAYDPTYLAYANTEYNTHYMNLAYTPQKALALKLSSEVFHHVPLYKDYGAYPKNAEFDGFRVSYEEDLAELRTAEKFIYTNHTDSEPLDEKNLKEVAGYGNSPVVQYNGTGAYFLDQIEKGVWRLEVLPDAVWIGNPFGRNSLQRKIAEINWRTWPMALQLADLGEEFELRPINAGNSWKPEVAGRSFSVRPGTYLVVKKGAKTTLKGTEKWKHIQLNEYAAQAATLEQDYVLHEPLVQLNEGMSYEVQATILTKDTPNKVTLITYDGWRPVRIDMEPRHGYTYRGTIPARLAKAGMLRYYITVENNGVTTYPGKVSGRPGDFGFEAKPYEVPVIEVASPVYLYEALADEEEVSRPWRVENSLVPLANAGTGELRLRIDRLFRVDPENPLAEPVHDYTLRFCFADKVKGRTQDLATATELVVRGHSLTDQPATIQVALITQNAQAFGALFKLNERGEYRVKLDELKPVKLVTMPRPYPTFLPYYFEREGSVPFDVSKIETLQISIGPGLSPDELMKKQEVALEAVWVE